MKFSIITPSFNQSAWLKLCVASIADQEGVELEHIVQDACSTDGTVAWLKSIGATGDAPIPTLSSQEERLGKEPERGAIERAASSPSPSPPFGEEREKNQSRFTSAATIRAFVEKDSGMYDAINRGWQKASGEILAYLNCDEQYLPGALKAVEETFQKNPDADIVLADTVVVDEKGGFVCCRKSLVPYRLWAWTYMPSLTSSIFFRRRVLDDDKLFFDTRWKILGDAFWMREAIALSLKIIVLRRYTSIFTETGENLWLKPAHINERKRAARLIPLWTRWFRWPLMQAHRVRAVVNRLYWERPFSYSLYTLAKPDQRSDVFVAKPTGIWWQRHKDARALNQPLMRPN